MEYIPGILKGLIITLLISLLSLGISVIPGYFVYMGKKSRVKILEFLCTAYIEIFEGIPVIVQLFFVYYALPLIAPALTFSPYITAIIVLTLNAIANMASSAKSQAKDFGTREHTNIKIAVLSAMLVLRRLIIYTSLLSVLGLTELFRSANKMMNATSNIYFIFIAIGIYLALSIFIKIIYKRVKESFLKVDAKEI
jgi:His/Glu/Gln/Arg/opine family amino acid ABC transporter permease subunit